MCQRFAPEPMSSSAARAFVREHLARAGEDAWPADLLVSELAANAIEHVGSWFTVHLTLDPVRVSVTDDGAHTDLRVVVPEDDDPRGRGLVLVDSFASRWGVTHHPKGGKTVWFEIHADAEADRAAEGGSWSEPRRATRRSGPAGP